MVPGPRLGQAMPRLNQAAALHSLSPMDAEIGAAMR